jgi:hypothetical protein
MCQRLQPNCATVPAVDRPRKTIYLNVGLGEAECACHGVVQWTKLAAFVRPFTFPAETRLKVNNVYYDLMSVLSGLCLNNRVIWCLSPALMNMCSTCFFEPPAHLSGHIVVARRHCRSLASPRFRHRH